MDADDAGDSDDTADGIDIDKSFDVLSWTYTKRQTDESVTCDESYIALFIVVNIHEDSSLYGPTLKVYFVVRAPSTSPGEII